MSKIKISKFLRAKYLKACIGPPNKESILFFLVVHRFCFFFLGQPALVLIHGFGASVYHWRYNIPALVKEGYRVLALDLLGFGLSDKPIIEYSAETWRDQVRLWCIVPRVPCPVSRILCTAPHTQLCP